MVAFCFGADHIKPQFADVPFAIALEHPLNQGNGKDVIRSGSAVEDATVSVKHNGKGAVMAVTDTDEADASMSVDANDILDALIAAPATCVDFAHPHQRRTIVLVQKLIERIILDRIKVLLIVKRGHHRTVYCAYGPFTGEEVGEVVAEGATHHTDGIGVVVQVENATNEVDV